MSDPESSSVTSSPAVIVMLSGDLIFASRVKAAAQRAGKEFKLSGSLPDGDLESVSTVIVDLSTRSGVLREIGGQCATRCPAASLIAYGPHVQVDNLEAARQAGIKIVMTNGQFDRELPRLFN